MSVVYLGGRFIEPEAAVVSLLDSGYLLGDGVFATMRGYDGRCFRARKHLGDLARGADLFGIDVPVPIDELIALADEAARRTGAADAYVRVTLTRGPSGGPPTLSIVARPMVVPSPDAYRAGVVTVIVGPRRVPPSCMDPSIKTTSYAPQVLARREVEAKNAVEGLQLAVDGLLACATAANIFLVVGDTLLTPWERSGCRLGVTRSAILELAPRVFREVRQERIDPTLLDEADEVFLTSTRVECLPVASVDGRRVGNGRFPRTDRCREALRSLIREERA